MVELEAKMPLQLWVFTKNQIKPPQQETLHRSIGTFVFLATTSRLQQKTPTQPNPFSLGEEGRKNEQPHVRASSERTAEQ